MRDGALSWSWLLCGHPTPWQEKAELILLEKKVLSFCLFIPRTASDVRLPAQRPASGPSSLQRRRPPSLLLESPQHTNMPALL